MLSPKFCECTAQGKVIDSRPMDQYTYRRLLCPVCGKRWSSLEFRLDTEVSSRDAIEALLRKLTHESNEATADRLIALAQEILHGGTK